MWHSKRYDILQVSLTQNTVSRYCQPITWDHSGVKRSGPNSSLQPYKGLSKDRGRSGRECGGEGKEKKEGKKSMDNHFQENNFSWC